MPWGSENTKLYFSSPGCRPVLFMDSKLLSRTFILVNVTADEKDLHGLVFWSLLDWSLIFCLFACGLGR